jgi:hypothetical protein
MLWSAQEMSKRFRMTLGKNVSPRAIHVFAEKLGYHMKRIGGKKGYDQSLYTALTRHLKELLDYDSQQTVKTSQKPQKQPILGDYYTYNGERDNIDYGWEKNENTIKENNMENLTILWLDDQRDPYKYLSTKSKSATFARNKQFYDNLLKQYNANFIWVKNIYQFIDYIEKNGIPQFVSFDHDLNNRGGGEGLSDEQKINNNGVNCAKWLVNYCKQNNQPLPKFYVHSANPKHGPEINRVLTSENKQIIRLTEQKLHKIIRESINKILKEEYGIIH